VEWFNLQRFHASGPFWRMTTCSGLAIGGLLYHQVGSGKDRSIPHPRPHARQKFRVPSHCRWRARSTEPSQRSGGRDISAGVVAMPPPCWSGHRLQSDNRGHRSALANSGAGGPSRASRDTLRTRPLSFHAYFWRPSTTYSAFDGWDKLTAREITMAPVCACPA
jgi:hypothetical protein